MRIKTLQLAWLPVFGIILFFLLYIVAAIVFPGGSQYNKADTSFSFIHNYWCDLLAEQNKRGEINPGRQFSVSAMFILCPVLMIFFYITPLVMGTEKKKRLIIQTAGVTSMLICMFIFTSLHDLVIPSAGIFGLIALGYLFTEIKQKELNGIFWSGIFCLFLMAANNFIYYTRIGVVGLPLLQKLTFIIFLSWIIYFCTTIMRRFKSCDNS